MQTVAPLVEIYTSEAGAVYQCNRRNRLRLHFAGTQTTLKVEAFLRLRKVVEGINLHEMATSTNRCSDFEVITICGCDRCFVLTLPELIAFKELLDGARFMLELNSMLHECLHAEVA
ncbi:hypothetical protein I2I11_11930 [Pontibacter sp. 172403-2]|uniref:hypothetical protein n=1 Tax=Pontibacter rufus TaxID=2791028 RepID=UPI0018AF57CB|nr:hypothetical protein [Pontibacter sp. 172403-2]MBF9254003.1 hypothetical protein [Pontibacter sp. 172403-2]